jgi:subtilisin family serine protease
MVPVARAAEPGGERSQEPITIPTPALQEPSDTNGVIVVFKDGVDAQEGIDRALATGAVDDNAPAKQLDLSAAMGAQAAVVQVADDVSLDQAIAELEANGTVAYAEPDTRLSLFDTTNDPLATTDPGNTSRQWYLPASGAHSAWDSTKTNRTVTVAVVDTGVRLNQLDLSANIDYDNAWDATRNQPLTTSSSGFGDLDGHGTMVAGIIAAQANNGTGIAGVSYNARILPMRVQDDSGAISTSYLINAYSRIIALYKSGRTDIKVINCSLGQANVPMSPLFYMILKEATNLGILTVAAAGNATGGTNIYNKSYPAYYPETISVAALNTDNQNYAPFSFSNDGNDITAAGVSIVSTYIHKTGTSSIKDPEPGEITTMGTGIETEGYEGIYASGNGTSFSAPIVAGAAALIWAARPDATVDQVRSALCDTAVDLGSPGCDIYYGWGRLDIPRALWGVGDDDGNGITNSQETAQNAHPSAPGGGETGGGGNTEPPEYADGIVDGATYYLRPVASLNKVLDVFAAGRDNGANIQLFTSNKTPAQRFTLRYDATSGYYTIYTNTAANMVLDAREGKSAPGTNVWQYTANGTDAQKWQVQASTNHAGAYTIASALDTTSVLDLLGAYDGDGNNIQLWTDNDSAAQAFYFVRADGVATAPPSSAKVPLDRYCAVLSLVAPVGQMALDLPGANKDNGVQFQIYESNGTYAQRFSFEDTGDGYYRIRNGASGRVLDVAGNAITPGTVVWQYNPNGTGAQQWSVRDNGDGSVTILARDSGLALDVQGGAATNGTKIHLYTPNGTNAQKFVIQ